MLRYVVVLLLSGAINTCTCSSMPTLHSPLERGKYHNHDATSKVMQDLGKHFPELVRVYSIGKSTNGLELQVLELSTLPTNLLSTSPKRNVHLIGSIFGDEPAGREILLNLAYHLLTSHTKDTNKTQLLDVLRIHILPAINPDGAEVSKDGTCEKGVGRRNLNGQNLDADFPLVNETHSDEPHKHELETEAVMYWMHNDPAVLTVTFRAGGYVITYPYETRRNRNDNIAILAPDDDILQHLARVYAQSHLLIGNGTVCNGRSFGDGFLNGALWKRSGKVGGLQDYVYGTQGSMHLNVALTCCRHPKANVLPSLWKENQASLLALLVEATGGLDGVLRDVTTHHVISGARLSIAGRSSVAFYSANLKGTFSRVLLPGSYVLEVKKEGYESQSLPVIIEKERKIYVGKQGFSTKIVFVEVFLGSVKESTTRRSERKDADNINSPHVNITMSVTPSVTTSTQVTVITTHLPQFATRHISGAQRYQHTAIQIILTISLIYFM